MDLRIAVEFHVLWTVRCTVHMRGCGPCPVSSFFWCGPYILRGVWTGQYTLCVCVYIAIGDYTFCFGGYADGSLSTVQRFDVKTKKWSEPLKDLELPQKLYGASAVVIGENVHVLCGASDDPMDNHWVIPVKKLLP